MTVRKNSHGKWAIATLAMVLRYAHLSPDARRDAARLLDRSHGKNRNEDHG